MTLKKIRLLTINATCEIGGSDTNLLRLFKRLNRDEYHIIHLVPYRGALFEDYRSLGIDIRVIDMPRIRIFRNPLNYLKVALKFLPTVARIKRVIEQEEIDIVITVSMVAPYGALAARLAAKPHILMATEYLFILKLIAGYFLAFSEKIICCSRMVASMFGKSKKVTVLYPGAELRGFDAAISPQGLKAGYGPGAKLVSMVSRLAPWKGIEVFIKAAALVKTDAKFVIFGAPVLHKEDYLKHLERKIAELHLQNKVFVRTDIQKDVDSAIMASDIIVHASIRPEPFGLIITDAMAMQKPVIAAGLGGPLEIIHDGIDGLLVNPGKPELLAGAIERLLSDEHLAEGLAAQAVKSVKRFDVSQYAASFDAIVKSTIKQSSAGTLKPGFFKRMLTCCLLPLSAVLSLFVRQTRQLDKQAVSNLLVVQLFGLGDLICSLPLMRALKMNFPDARLTVLVDEKFSSISSLAGYYIDEAIGCKKGIFSKMLLLYRIRKGGFDLAVSLNPLFQGIWFAYSSSAKARTGYIRDYEGMQDASALKGLLTIPLLPQDYPMHDSLRYLDIARLLGLEFSEEAFGNLLMIPESARNWSEEFLKKNEADGNSLLFGINPCAGWSSRCWGISKFAEVADVLAEKYKAKALFFGSSSEEDRGRIAKIQSLMKHRSISAAGYTDMPKLAALIKRCGLFLTNDSGPMHLAAALGVPMVAVFGPGDAVKFGYDRSNVLNIVGGHCYLRPCILNYRYQKECRAAVCINEITPLQVLEAVEKIMRCCPGISRL